MTKNFWRIVMVDTRVDPDEQCQICHKKRDEHGDMNHKFSTDGQLIPIEREKPRQQPPVHREDPKSTPTDRAFATLLEVLIEKNMLDARDVLRIMSGQG
jgi:hypothetical protein